MALAYNIDGKYVFAYDGGEYDVDKIKNLPHCVINREHIAAYMTWGDKPNVEIFECPFRFSRCRVTNCNFDIVKMIMYKNILCCIGTSNIATYETDDGQPSRWILKIYSCPKQFYVINCTKDHCVISSGDTCYKISETMSEVLSHRPRSRRYRPDSSYRYEGDEWDLTWYGSRWKLDVRMTNFRKINGLSVYQTKSGYAIISNRSYSRIIRVDIDISRISYMEMNDNTIAIQTNDGRNYIGTVGFVKLIEYDGTLDPPITSKSARSI